MGAASLLLFLTLGQSVQMAEATADRCLFEEALRMLDASPQSELQGRESQLFRARLLVQLGRGKEAVEIVRKVPKAKDEGDRLLLLGLALSAAKEPQEAEKALREAESNGADKDLIESAIGMLRIQTGKLAEAEAILRRVLKRAPLLTGALYNLACVRSLNGDIAEAASLIRLSWQAGLKDPDQLKKDPMLAAVRAREGLIDDLVSSPIRHCGTY